MALTVRDVGATPSQQSVHRLHAASFFRKFPLKRSRPPAGAVDRLTGTLRLCITTHTTPDPRLRAAQSLSKAPNGVPDGSGIALDPVRASVGPSCSP